MPAGAALMSLARMRAGMSSKSPRGISSMTTGMMKATLSAIRVSRSSAQLHSRRKTASLSSLWVLRESSGRKTVQRLISASIAGSQAWPSSSALSNQTLKPSASSSARMVLADSPSRRE